MTNQNLFSIATRNVGQNLENGLDVSSYADAPYHLFSPFAYNKDYRIPVPGQKMSSCSVEAIWQGLKIINGFTDFSLFTRKPKKRGGNVIGHLYGEEILDVQGAREAIYHPAYFFHVEHHIGRDIKESVLEMALERGVCFFDVEENLDINNPAPLAHSYFLKMYFNKYLNKRKIITAKKLNKNFEISVEPNETIAEPIARSLNLFKNSPRVDQLLINLVLEEPVDYSFFRYYRKLKESMKKS